MMKLMEIAWTFLNSIQKQFWNGNGFLPWTFITINSMEKFKKAEVPDTPLQTKTTVSQSPSDPYGTGIFTYMDG